MIVIYQTLNIMQNERTSLKFEEIEKILTVKKWFPEELYIL